MFHKLECYNDLNDQRTQQQNMFMGLVGYFHGAYRSVACMVDFASM
jgi:hypothetical protein